MDARSGATKWTYSYPTEYRDDFGFDEGPRATPCIADGKVYTFGALRNAHMPRSCRTAKKFGRWTQKRNFTRARGSSAWRVRRWSEGANVLLDIGGGGGAGIVAFDKGSGKVAWKCANDEAGYASPVAATIHDKRYAFFFTRAGLVAADPMRRESAIPIPLALARERLRQRRDPCNY